MKGLSTLEGRLLHGLMTRIEEVQVLCEAKGLQAFNALLMCYGSEMPIMIMHEAIPVRFLISMEESRECCFDTKVGPVGGLKKRFSATRVVLYTSCSCPIAFKVHRQIGLSSFCHF